MPESAPEPEPEEAGPELSAEAPTPEELQAAAITLLDFYGWPEPGIAQPAYEFTVRDLTRELHVSERAAQDAVNRLLDERVHQSAPHDPPPPREPTLENRPLDQDPRGLILDLARAVAAENHWDPMQQARMATVLYKRGDGPANINAAKRAIEIVMDEHQARS